jgi:hypothetical protein
MKRIDLTGQRFGRLVVIEEAERRGYTRRWNCKCDCGNSAVVDMGQLRSGKTKSCGCLNRERTSQKNLRNLAGRRFGKLSVIRRASSDDKHKTQKGRAIWECRCDCGKVVNVLSTYLTNGDTQSCGCRRSEVGHQVYEHVEETYRKDGVLTTTLKRKVRSDSSTGIKGVTIVSKTGKYRASISVKGKRYWLGDFTNLEAAVAARKAGEEKYHQPYLEEKDSGK